jgi:asparagine synthase (glutamine-hydrolysing)
LRRHLACSPIPLEPIYEKRYPYLDRDLLEFIYGVPREQLVRPGQRRSLMRRALIGIVPEELLNRKRKAFLVRSPVIGIATRWMNLTQGMVTNELGIVDSNHFANALRNAQAGMGVSVVTLLRTLLVESWLRNLQAHTVVHGTKLGVRLCRQLRRPEQWDDLLILDASSGSRRNSC